jgi:murein DD-endopeptidase MepM/ murein hydrolase activator NlpD
MKKIIFPSLGLIILAVLVYCVGLNNSIFQTSVVSLPEHKIFDGTAFPVKIIPNYVKLKADRYNLAFDQYSSNELIDIPFYDAIELRTSVNDLKWGNPEHDKIRNAKITYSVPYMGNYRLDGQEYAGSHLAVDLKIPTGTPIYSIANGVVTKVSNQSSGFGNHIVVRHNNVPTLEDPNKKTVLYSSYSHLSQTNVSQGDIVLKGQMIAKSGATGTATTPHLHFQIDNSDSPWQPYWPFTWKEAQDAGLDFFSAVNAGLGKDKGIALTVHPMLYVQKYINFGGVNIDIPKIDPPASAVIETPVLESPSNEDLVLVSPEDTNSYIENETDSEEVVDNPDNDLETVEETVDEIVVELPIDPILNFNFKTEEIYYYEGKDLNFKLSMVDQFGEKFAQGFPGDVLIESVNQNIRISSPLINFMSFNSGKEIVKNFVVRNSGKERLRITLNGETFLSDWFEVIKVEKESVFKDVSTNSKYHDALVYLKNKEVIDGYPDGTFKVSNKLSRVEALKLILHGSGQRILAGSSSFKDTEKGSWYDSYLFTAVKNGVVSGYEDGTFRPANTVNKAEFYKMLLNSAGVVVEDSVSYSPFVDVETNAWFAPFFIKAYEMEIIDSDIKYISPSEAINRGEAAYAIFKTLTNL